MGWRESWYAFSLAQDAMGEMHIAAKGHILIVDDVHEVRLSTSRIIEGAGYRVSTASAGLEGLMAVEREQVDLVLLDFNMPGLSGLDVLRTIRQKHSKLALPVILVTGRTDDSDVLDALNSGANDYVTKPVMPLILLARVATHLSMKVENEAFRNEGPVALSIDSIEVGTVLAERYEIHSRLSRGGFGDIFKAKQVSTGQTVAIKTIRSDLSEEAGSRGSQPQLRFETELRVLAQASHPHIVKLVDSGRLADGNLFLVLDYIDGLPLYKYIDNRGGLSFQESQHLMRQVLDALSCAHELGVIHSDVSPGNIMVSSTGHLSNAHVLDFGVVNLTQRSTLDRNVIPDERGLIVGTPQYMAPEQIERGQRTAQTDLFSWGLLFAECLLGRPVIPASKPLAVRQFFKSTKGSVVESVLGHFGVSRFLQKVTAIDPKQRFQSSTEALVALDEVVKGYQNTHATRKAPPLVDDTELVSLPSAFSRDDSYAKTIVDEINPSEED